MKTLGSLLAILILGYLGICLLFSFFQEKLIFFPTPKDPARIARLKTGLPGFAETSVTAKDGRGLAGYLCLPPNLDPDAPLILYFGGNAEDVSANFSRQDLFAGFALAAFNYRGYGGSSGSPGEEALKADALAIYDALADGTREIVVMGRSLGAAMAAHVAARRPVGAAVLITPADSIKEVAGLHYPWLPVSLMLRHPFDAIQDARASKAPALILAAAKDDIIPVERARILAAAWAGPKRLVILPGVGHNDIEANPDYRSELRQFLSDAWKYAHEAAGPVMVSPWTLAGDDEPIVIEPAPMIWEKPANEALNPRWMPILGALLDAVREGEALSSNLSPSGLDDTAEPTPPGHSVFAFTPAEEMRLKNQALGEMGRIRGLPFAAGAPLAPASASGLSQVSAHDESRLASLALGLEAIKDPLGLAKPAHAFTPAEGERLAAAALNEKNQDLRANAALFASIARSPAPILERIKAYDVLARSAADPIERVLIYAHAMLGVPYVTAGDFPQTGFDCSGFTCFVFDKTGVSLPRHSGTQYRQGREVHPREMRPGDLVFFASRGPINHVGIYLTDGKFIHCASATGGVAISTLDDPFWKSRFVGGRRVL